MMRKKVLALILTALAVCTLVACGQRNDLSVSDFPRIGSGLTKSELEQAVGKPHESSKSIIDVTEMMLELLIKPVSIDADPNWNSSDIPTEYYLYKLADKDYVMVAILVGDQVVEMTTEPLRYED